MRIGQLQSLTQDEISMLLYIINNIDPILGPKIEFGPKELLWIKHDKLLLKISQQESKLSDSGKEIFKGLMSKLNRTPQQEYEDYEKEHKNEPSIQLEFQLCENIIQGSQLTQSEFQF